MKLVKDLRLQNLCLLLSVMITALGCRENTPPPAGEEGTPVKPPEQIISLPQAQTMYKNYSARRMPLIRRFEDSINRHNQDTVKFDVARYIHYDYATIKQYLTYIEQVAQEAGVDISTLRFYFSNYPNQKTFEDGRPVKHPRQNSIFIIPALEHEGADYGFYTEQNAEGKWVPVLLDGSLQPYKADGMGGRMESSKNYAGFIPEPNASTNTPSVLFDDTKSTILNYGGSAPPPHN